MKKIVLLRHGQSVWNKEPKKFTGWTDVERTEKGIEEAREAGKKLKKAGFKFDRAYSSVLKRAASTLHDVFAEMGGHQDIPVDYSWRLNERHYGALQGLTHEEMTAKYGADQVKIWRRSFDVKPPLVEETDNRHPINDPKYSHMPKHQLPNGESLKDTIARVLPHWQKEIAPHIKNGESVIIAASGNSLRALIKHLEGISDQEIVGLEIATGAPLVYELEDESLVPIKRYYLE